MRTAIVLLVLLWAVNVDAACCVKEGFPCKAPNSQNECEPGYTIKTSDCSEIKDCAEDCVNFCSAETDPILKENCIKKCYGK